MVEVRDRMSQRVREQIELIEGQDYEIDPLSGSRDAESSTSEYREYVGTIDYPTSPIRWR